MRTRSSQFRALVGLLIPVACAALFVRLGLWQRARHQERVAINAEIARQLAGPPVAFDSLRGDSAGWRRVSLSGRFRYDLEQVQGPRTNGGSPGVHLLTPLERPGNDTLVIVTRGWVYSADGASVDLARWREADHVTLTGYVVPLVDDSAAGASTASATDVGVPPAPAAGRPLRNLSRPMLRSRVGAPVARAHVVMTSDSVPRADSVPRRLALPALDDGNHFSYMMQWFAFAAIALVGGVILYRRSSIVGPPPAG